MISEAQNGVKKNGCVMKLDNPVCKTVASVLVGNFGAGCVFIEAGGGVGDCFNPVVGSSALFRII